MNLKLTICCFVAFTLTLNGFAQETTDSTAKSKSLLELAKSVIEPEKTKTEQKKSHWYEKINLRGYVQIRYNRLLETNPDLKSEQGDRSIGNNGGFFIRRARLIFSGQLNFQILHSVL